jgi:hypothetical protein
MSMEGGVRLYASTVSLCIRDLSIHGFCYLGLQDVLEPFPTDTEGHCTSVPTGSCQSHLPPRQEHLSPVLQSGSFTAAQPTRINLPADKST